MRVRRAFWLLFLALFAALLIAYAVGIAVSWTDDDGSRFDAAAAIFAIAVLPGIVAALNAALIDGLRRTLVVVGAIALAATLAALVVAATEHDVSGFIAVLTAIVLLAVAVTVAVALRWDVGYAMMGAASIAVIVASGVSMLTWLGAFPISIALIIVAALTVNTARIQRLVPWWPIVAVIVVFMLATSGIALVVVVPIAIVLAVVAWRRRATSTSAP